MNCDFSSPVLAINVGDSQLKGMSSNPAITRRTPFSIYFAEKLSAENKRKRSWAWPAF